ncbi:MAG: phosphatidate cytidylyltransferase [Chitinophagaceae bacterium]
MKKNLFLNYLIILLSVCMLSSCEAIGGIFKAGVWSGVLLVVAVIGLIIFIISKVAGKK